MHYFLRNYRINAKIHNFSISLHVLGQTTQAQLPSFTFMALYSILLYLKYYNVLQWESRFPLELNSTKNTNYVKNDSNKNCSELNFL